MNNNSNEMRVAATQPCRRREAAGWLASPNKQTGFESFAGFVTKKKSIN